MSLLVDVSDKSTRFSWPVAGSGETFIGRIDQCGVCLKDGGASRRHCVIVSGPAGFTVRDLNSANGTFLNGRRVARAALKAGDRLRVGFTELEFRVESPADDEATRVLAAPVADSAELPVPVPVPVRQRRLPVGGVPPAAPRDPGFKIEFCSRCSGSISRAVIASGRARVVDGELLCPDCMGRDSTRMGMVPVAERPLAPAAKRRPGAAGAVQPRATASAPSAAKAASRPAATFGRKLRAWGALGLSLAVLGLCLMHVSAAWLNFERLIHPTQVPLQAVPVEEVARSPLGITLDCKIKPEGGEEVAARLSAGIFGKLQYDDYTRKAQAAGGVAHFDVIYDAGNPARSALADKFYGLAPLIAGLLMIFWAAREGWGISKFYRRPAVARAS